MVVDTVQVRRQGSQDFGACYDSACAMHDLVPSPAVKAHLGRGTLDFNGDRLKLTDWPPILSSLAVNKQLLQVAVSSSYQAGPGETDSRYRSTLRKKIPVIRSKEMTFKLCKAVRECLSVSPTLKTLQLHALPLRERDLITLTKGLAKSLSLENLSLAHCSIADVGLEAVCQSVKNSATIRTVDFTGCNLTWRGAEHMANIIKHQAMRRHGAAWAESLRYRKPEFEGMGGLRRVTLSCNALIGDRGAAALAQELAEDLWVKAVDLQKCGLSSEGARSLLEALQSNSTLCVLDIRSNPLVDKDLVKTVIEKVLMNSEGQASQYSWIKPPSQRETQKPSVPKRRALRGKTMFRTGPRKAPTTCGRSPGVQRPPRPSSDKRIPWRTAARADRQRGLPPGSSVAEQSFQAAGNVKVTLETESEEEEEEEEEEAVTQSPPSGLSFPDSITARQYKRLQVELEESRLRLAEERSARVKAEARLMEYELENARLRSVNFSLSEALQAPPTGASSVLEDDAVLDSIESSFNKFHAFLDLLKDAGLGQLASMAGIDQSDFGPLGKPQLSSTVGRPLGGGGAGGRARDTAERDGGAPLGGDASRASSRGPPNGLTPGAPASPREFPPEFSKQEVPLALASGPAVEEPGGELNQQRGARSEHSICSNSSHGSSSHGKNSHGSSSYGKGTRGATSQPHHGNGNGSDRSCGSRGDGFHGRSFNYSNVSHVHSNGHRSNGSHGETSVRSSLSELSERAGSVGSRGSGGGVSGRGGGQRGSEEEVRLYSGFGVLEQVRSLGSLGSQSDDGF